LLTVSINVAAGTNLTTEANSDSNMEEKEMLSMQAEFIYLLRRISA